MLCVGHTHRGWQKCSFTAFCPIPPSGIWALQLIHLVVLDRSFSLLEPQLLLCKMGLVGLQCDEIGKVMRPGLPSGLELSE